MSVCLLFVFTALLEYAAVNVLSRKKGARIINPSGVSMPAPPSPASHTADGLTAVAQAAAGCVGGAAGNQRRPRMLPLMQRLDVEEQMDQVGWS